MHDKLANLLSHFHIQYYSCKRKSVQIHRQMLFLYRKSVYFTIRWAS